MITMASAGLTDKIVREIISGKRTSIAMTSCSRFVQNYHVRKLTHLSLPGDLAVELKSITLTQKKEYRSVQNKMVEYTVFELGQIVPRSFEDTYKNLKSDRMPIQGSKPCKVIQDLRMNGVRFRQGDCCCYKISQFPTKHGDRYLIFVSNIFRAGFNEEEFKQTFEEVTQ